MSASALAQAPCVPLAVRFPRVASEGNPNRQVQGLPEERLLELALQGRSATGDDRAHGEAAWAELVARNLDRVESWVNIFHFPGQGNVRIPKDDVQDVTQEVWFRAAGMLGGLRGTDIKTFRSALRGCTSNTCKDYCRGEMNRDKRRGGSLDEPSLGSEGEETDQGRYDTVIAERSQQERALAEEAAERRVLAEDLIAELGSEGQRRALTDMVDGYEASETANRMGISVDAVYQHRSRGIKRIAKELNDE